VAVRAEPFGPSAGSGLRTGLSKHEQRLDGFTLRQAQGERKNLQAITREVSLLNPLSRIRGICPKIAIQL